MADNSKKERKRQSYVPLICFLYLALVLSTVIFPGFTRIEEHDKAINDLTVCRQNLEIFHKALVKYARTHNGKVPERISDLYLGKNKLIEEAPMCPASDKPTYTGDSYTFIQGSPLQQARYTIVCRGFNHAVLGLGKNEPYFSTIRGAVYPSESEMLSRKAEQANADDSGKKDGKDDKDKKDEKGKK